MAAQCEASSWRQEPRRTKTYYGPGGFNRCVGEAGHVGAHVDGFNNRFRKTTGGGTEVLR